MTPLVLVHGLLDTPRVFHPLEAALAGRRRQLLSPSLPLQLGRIPVVESAVRLRHVIETTYGKTEPVDVLGFSIGGVIVRTWLQLLGGHVRCRRFFSVGSPQQGTFMAQPWPSRWFSGLADLKPNSPLLNRLNNDLDRLRHLEIYSFYSAVDLVVLPGWNAVVPVGKRVLLPVLTHPELVRNPMAIRRLTQELLRP